MGSQTRLDLGLIYSVLRFDGQGAGIDSDTYGFTSNLSHGFTPRFNGMVGYNFTYIDLRSGHGDNATVHNPTLGFSYRVTPTLSIAIDGGPAFTHLGNEDFITPAFNAGFSQRLPFGNVSAYYARSVGVAGGFGGPTDNQTASATLLLPLLRDLIVIFNPAWTKAESLSDQQIERVDVKIFTLTLGAAYRVNPLHQAVRRLLVPHPASRSILDDAGLRCRPEPGQVRRSVRISLRIRSGRLAAHAYSIM